MEHKDGKTNNEKSYEAPEILASYSKEELEAVIQPEGQSTGGCGCGCGCGGLVP